MTLVKTHQRSTTAPETESSFADLAPPRAPTAELAGAPEPLIGAEPENDQRESPTTSVNPAHPLHDGPAQPMLFVAAMGELPAPPPAPDTFRIRAETQQIRELIAELETTEMLPHLAARWNRPPSVPWNEVAAELVAEHGLDRWTATRLYTLLSVAQYDAAIVAGRAKEDFLRPAPAHLVSALPLRTPAETVSAYPAHHAAVGAASKEILADAFPGAAAELERLFSDHLTTRLVSGVSFPSDLSAGAELGRHVARDVERQVGEFDREPILALLSDEARRESIGERGIGEIEPTTDRAPSRSERWNELARELIAAYEPDDVEAARALAYLNVALHDSALASGAIAPPRDDGACVDAALTGAAVAVLTHFFPDEGEPLLDVISEPRTTAERRALEIGSAIGELAVRRAKLEE